MIRKILGTFGTKAGVAIMNFLIVMITARVLGAEGRGVISLIVAGITMILMLNNFIGGSTLIYLSPRHPHNRLIFISLIWAVLSSLLGLLFIEFTDSEIKEYKYSVFFLSLLFSMYNINSYIIAGRKSVGLFNLLNFLQILFRFLLILIFFYMIDSRDVKSFILALFISNAAVVLISLFFIKDSLNFKIEKLLFQTGIAAFAIGFFSQLSNISQFLNYRLSFFLIEFFRTKAEVGIFSTGTAISESIWMVGSAMALVQYIATSNTEDIEKAGNLTVKMARINLLISLSAIVPLLLIPEEFYLFIFGTEFSGIKTVIYTLSPGIAAIGFSFAFSHYFAGIGRNKINAICSGSGLFFSILFGILFIPKWGIFGAGISTSLAYLINTALFVYFFQKDSKQSLRKLIPGTGDLQFIFLKIFRGNKIMNENENKEGID